MRKGADRVYSVKWHFSSETRKIWSLFVWICLPEFLLIFYINFQKCVSSPTRCERSRMSTFWCGWGLCLQQKMEDLENSWLHQTVVSAGLNVILFQEIAIYFSGLKWKISCHGPVPILYLRINNCLLIFLIFYCIRLIDPVRCSWAGLLSFLNRCCLYLIVNGTDMVQFNITVMLQSTPYYQGEFNIRVTAILLVTGRERVPLEEGDATRKS